MKAEWGTKRMCQGCGAPFYDMRRSPIVCPKCGATFDPEVFTKVRRARPQPVEEKPPPPKKKPPVIADEEELVVEAEETDEFEDIEGEETDEEDVIEDASELGEDETEVAPVPKKGEED